MNESRRRDKLLQCGQHFCRVTLQTDRPDGATFSVLVRRPMALRLL